MKPIYTERSLADAKKGVYTFVFSRQMTKPQIKKLVAEVFGVVVDKVRTVTRQPGVHRNLYGKTTKKKGFKKALITLKSGTIDLFEAKKDKK